MAAPSKYLPAHEQMLELAIDARHRGLSFMEFWHEAVRPGVQPIVMTTTEDPPPGAIRWPTDRNDRVNSLYAIEETIEGWSLAYDRLPPTRSQAALKLLSPIIDELKRRIEAVEDPLSIAA